MNRPDRDRAILSIAEQVFKLTTLETRSSDRLDFHDIPVWQVREALEAAYDAGFKAAGGQIADDNP